ncbi:ornithine cyclodeaminase [Acetobacteraceae bacterium ESL0709]|nr:ornithine cyclodeaminase [Acetobacteraceae bacterium ESL0697]MDF7677797.1 ornithine cyclodeaminase [Acetobacteraceae bacterium ESL0709]
MKFITAHDFMPHLDWKAAVAAIRNGHRFAKAETNDSLLGPREASLFTRSAYAQGSGCGVKVVTIFKDNPHLGLPVEQGIVLFFDEKTGSLKSLLESPLVTGIKTAADSVCGAVCLARSDSQTLLIVGAGQMARSVAEAYNALFPSLKRIMIWSRRPEQAENLARELMSLACPVKAVSDLPGACGEADIISTVTAACEPVIHGAWIKPGTHIDLIGAYRPDMREADDNLIGKGRVFVDSYDTTIHHIGELLLPIQAGVLSEDDVQGDLYALIAGKCGRQTTGDITIFKNGGGAHLDIMIARYITETLAGVQ